MEKIKICIAFVCVLFSTASAQINVQLRVMPPYQSRIADYASRPELMLLTVSNTSTAVQQIQLTGTITGNNGVAVWIRPGFRSPAPVTLNPGQILNLNGNDIVPLFDHNQIEYTGISQADFTRGVGLQEGTYQICIQALDYTTLQPLSPAQPIGCSPLIISSVEPPRVIAPHNEQVITENAAQAFPITWSTSPGGPVMPNYRVKLVEIFGDINANDAMRTAFSPPFFDRVVQTNTLLYGPADPKLIPGRRYALMVQAVDPLGKTSFRNQGQSEVVEFTYQERAPLQPVVPQTIMAQIPAGATPICASCNITQPTGNAANDLILQQAGERKIKVNQFEMNVLTVQNTGGKLSGTGTIALPVIGQISAAIKLRVEFSGVSINSSYQLLEGMVKGITRSDFGFIPTMDNPDLNTVPLDSRQVDQLDQYFKNNRDQLVSSVNQSVSSIGMELPLGIDKGAFTVGVTHIFFNSTQAWMEAVAVMNMPDANMKVAFSGRGICINPQDLCGEATLLLSEDAPLGPLGITLNGGNEGTKLVFDSKGFKVLHIAATYQFPQGAPLLDATTNEPLKVKLTASTETSWADWVAVVDIDAFKVGAVSDIQFGKTGTTTKIIYDHSDLHNAENMPDRIESGDPKDAPILIDNNWTGFFIPAIAVYLPQAIQQLSGDRVQIEATNIIYQEGICGQIVAKDILGIGNGSLDGWFLSIDEVGLNFWKNSFKESYLAGKLVLPPSGSNATNQNNQIDYTCTLTKPAGESMAFQFTATARRDLAFEALWTKVNISSSSNILVRVDGEGFIATATLHGDMKFQTDIAKLPKLTLGELTFQNMKISSRAPLFDPGQIDFHTGGDDMGWMREHADFSDMLASSQRKGPYHYSAVDEVLVAAGGSSSVLGFELAETAVHPFLEGNQVGFRFGAAMQLVNNVNFIPKASIDFKVYGELDGLAKNGRKFWKAVRGKIEKVELEAKAKLGPMNVEGAVYYHDIDVGGNLRDYGLGGRLNVVLPGAGMKIGMQALFGSRVGTSNFQYFYIDALVDLGNSGIPLFPGTALYGFAGGVYYNMNQDTSARRNSVGASMPATDDKETTDPTLIQMTSFSGTKYTPDGSQGGRFGVIAGVYFGLSSRNTLEGQLAMDIRFNGSHGFEYFGLDGRAAILTGTDSDFLQRYDKAMARAHMYLKINMLNGLFHKFEAGFGYSLEYIRGVTPLALSAQGTMEFYIENTLAANPGSEKGTIWYFRMGRPRPQQPNRISFMSDFIQSDAYFQVGNMIDPMPPLPDRIREIMGVSSNGDNANGFDNDRSYESVKNSRNEQLVSSGKGMIFGALTELKADPKFLIFYASLYAGVGFDVSILQRDKPECGQPAGSWYARGQAYIGAEAACGVRVRVFGFKKDIEFVRAGLGAAAELGGPAPLYVRGILGGRFAVLDGLISGRFNIKFTVGTVCDNSTTNRELKLIADIYPGGGNVSTAAQAAVSFNFPLNKDFIVPITTTDKDGNIKSVAYDLFRFRPEYVTINVSENGNTVFDRSDFDLAMGLTALPENSPYRRSSPLYKLALKSGGDLLKRKTNYKIDVTAKAKYFPDLKQGRGTMETLKDNLAEQTFRDVLVTGTRIIYIDRKDSTFTTDNGPKKISLEHLVDILPVHRHRSLPAQTMSNVSSFLKLSRGYSPDNNTFDTNISSPQATVRIVNMASGATEVSKLEVPLHTGDRTNWNFAMPTLAENNNYAIRMYLKGQPTAAPAANTQGGTMLSAVSSLSMAGEGLVAGGTARINSRKLMENALRMGPGEHEVFSWYFNTGQSKTFKDKYNALKINKLTVNGMEASLQQDQQVNLTNFNWFDSSIRSVTAMHVTYEFTGDEYFNKLDDDTWTIGQVFPNVGNTNTAAKLSRNYPGMAYDHAQNVTELDRIFRDFVRQAFGSSYELNINMMTMPWNPITGGIDSYTENIFPHLSDIMGQDLFGVNYSENNYGTPPKAESHAADLNPASDQKTESGMVSSILLNTKKYSTLFSAQAVANSVVLANMGQPKKVFTVKMTIHHQSGVGVTTGMNTLFKNMVQQKKNLGYPADLVGRAGILMDQVKTMTSPANLQIQMPVQAPKVNVKMR
ncbi:hypothetical protein [Sphingobacterium pedocola]|uniref:TANFOR domain-containing protein n=1 Tax=Sphingobacterium pedocola TaxID=2082722 RepID=A0ABR9T7M7_9SPHI|nr:hypothetical protein [Sphingobacterium pedocola]MBE8720879.1 hypothetical protein [Sphingobacterium pedocola]